MKRARRFQWPVWVLAVPCGTVLAGDGAGFAPDGAPAMKADQVNTAQWKKAWTNLVNDTEQTFTPSRAKLLAVEVQLLVGNPGAAADKLTMSILDSFGKTVASASHQVQASDCEHVMFVIPDGGVDLMPGETYRIKLTGGTTFGWKYVVGGYPRGEALFNGKPLLADERSTFLFRAFAE